MFARKQLILELTNKIVTCQISIGCNPQKNLSGIKKKDYLFWGARPCYVAILYICINYKFF
jgi:hypothetical protein